MATLAHDYFHLLPQVLPMVVFFGAVMSVLYYLGLMQWIIRKVRDQKGWVTGIELIISGTKS